MRFLVTAIFLLAHTGFSSALAAADLDRLIATAPAGSKVGVAIYHGPQQAWLHRHAADRSLQLASVTKLPVAAAALLDLGPDFAFTTRVVALGPITDGICDQLAIIGGGSPCLDEHFTERDPNRIPRQWAGELQAAGIRGARQPLIIDSSIFDTTWRPSSYPDDHRNAQQWYSAPASGFAFNDNCIDVQVAPAAPGERALVRTRPASARITIDNKSRSVATKGDGRLNVYRHHRTNTLVVSGKYAKQTAWFALAIRDDPDLLAGDHIAGIWQAQGIKIAQPAIRQTVDPNAGQVIVTHHDPLLPALRILNQRSQNHYGEQIIRYLGYRHLGLGSTENGTQAVHRILAQQLGIDRDITLLDGSGLSYENRATPTAICTLLDRMLRSEHAEAWLSTFKEHTFHNTTVLAKTGTLSVARCLAGYVPLPNGGYASFAILLNRGSAKSIGWARTLRSKLTNAIVENLTKP